MPDRRLILLFIVAYLSLGALRGFAQPSSIAPVVQPQAKIALLIGNWDYNQDGKYTEAKDTPHNRLSDLSNPCNDVELIQSKLIALKWKVDDIMLVCNGTKGDILNRLQDFTQRYMQSDQPFGFIYYAGHGVQIDKDSYIFGTDTGVDVQTIISMYKRHGSRANLFKGGIKITREILATIGDPGRGSLLVVMDACRENPLYSLLAKEGLLVSGPKQSAVAARGIKVFYSTADGDVAPDGALNSNSDFADVFAAQMVVLPTVDHLLRTVADVMYERTKYAAKPQIPDEAGTLNRPPPEICFTECK
ncbi:caspase family protein [Mesorhizobium caraganae]|uniref:Caspase family protein n=1 Tax=Mesorhizobium caraganae TaxID=483206 RepID=A0ABV1Z0H4_9HYPH